MEGNRVRKRKKTAVFFRVSACRIFKIKKQKTKNEKKKKGKKVKSKLIIKYNRGKTSMQIQNLRNRKRFSNSNRDLSQSSVCYNHILSCGYFSCEDKRKKTNWNYKEIYRNKLLSCESWILKKWLCSWLSLITFSRYNACNLTVLNHGGSFSSHQLFNNLESAIRISPLFAKMRTNHVKLILNFETSVPRKTRRKKNAFFPWQL